VNAGQEIDTALARALGERVCGGVARAGRCERCGAYVPTEGRAVTHGDPPPPYSSSWEAAGSLIGEMEAKGWRLVRLSREELGPNGYRESFAHFERFEDEGKPWFEARSGDAWADTPPHALALAALRALGGEG
jgi:hypothetical protein